MILIATAVAPTAMADGGRASKLPSFMAAPVVAKRCHVLQQHSIVPGVRKGKEERGALGGGVLG